MSTISTVLGRSGCFAYVQDGFGGSFRPCEGTVVVAGLIHDRRRRETWLGFACAGHREHLDEAHPPTDAEWAEREHRRRQEQLGLAGKPYERVRPLPG